MNFPSVKSMQPLLIETSLLVRFMGRYYLSRIEEKIDTDKQKYWLLELSDASGVLDVYCFTEEFMQKKAMEGKFIHIEASLTQRAGSAHFRCKNVLVDVHENVGTDLSVLPRSVCPFGNTLDVLFFLVNRISHNLLRDFVRDVLLQTDVGVSYLSCPASLDSHHSYEGGLLVHSLETAWQILNIEELTETEREITVVAALLCNVGKVISLQPDLRKLDASILSDNNDSTIKVCKKPLKKLGNSAPKLAERVRNALSRFSAEPLCDFESCSSFTKYMKSTAQESKSREVSLNHIQ